MSIAKLLLHVSAIHLNPLLRQLFETLLVFIGL